MDRPNTPQGEGTQRWFPRWGCLAFLLLVLYPLSIGPAVALSNSIGEWVSEVYAPVIWLADALGMTDLLLQYVYVWLYVLG